LYKEIDEWGLAVGCAAIGLSNAGSACKDILDLGFSLGRKGIMLYELKYGSASYPGLEAEGENANR